MIKVLIVEDQTLLQKSLEHLINSQEDMKVIGGTDDAEQAPVLCRKLKPDLVLMDVVTKNRNSGIKYTAVIRKELPDIKVIIMTALPEITFADEAKKAGAHSFVSKEMDSVLFLNTIRTTMQGYSTYSTAHDHIPFNAEFSEKEITLLQLVCQGKSRKDIAKIMDVSEATAKQYITSILNKTGFDNISKLAIKAVDEGYIKILSV